MYTHISANSIMTSYMTYKFQTALTDEKHVQYIFCTLGTPRAMGYGDWSELPFADSLGSHIKVCHCVVWCGVEGGEDGEGCDVV